MHGAGATESIDDEFLRQITRAHDLAANQIRHLGIDDVENSRGGFVDFQFQWSSDLVLDECERFFFIQMLPPAEKITGIDDAEREIAVGHRHLFAARVVADRTRTGAGAARAHQ